MAIRREVSGFLTGAAVLAIVCATVAVAQSQSRVLTITLAGQSMIRSDIRLTAPATISAMRPLLKGDVIFTNLESTVAEKGQTIHEGSGLITPPEALDALTALGFNLLDFATNHSFDLYETGIQNTIREADLRKIAHAGTGNNLAEASAAGYLHTPKGTIALVASASGLVVPGADATADKPGVNELHIETADNPRGAPKPEDSQRILQSIQEARRHADLVIVYQHNHVFVNLSGTAPSRGATPQRLAPDPWLIQWTHAEIDAGADIVVMHGNPLLHGVEIYRGHPIFYDLGNFMYNLPAPRRAEPMNWESAIATVQFRGRKLRSISLRPVVLNDEGQGVPDLKDEYDNNQYLDTRGLPSPATGAKANHILQWLVEASKPFGTSIEIKGDKAEVRLNAGN